MFLVHIIIIILIIIRRRRRSRRRQVGKARQGEARGGEMKSEGRGNGIRNEYVVGSGGGEVVMCGSGRPSRHLIYIESFGTRKVGLLQTGLCVWPWRSTTSIHSATQIQSSQSASSCF